MIVAGLSEAAIDEVVRSLQGSTLVELLRASLEGHDLPVLHSMEKNGRLDDALLTQEFAEEKPNWRRSAVMAGAIRPMLDALGQILQVNEWDASKKSGEAKHKQWKIRPEIAAFVARHIQHNLQDFEKSLEIGLLISPGHNGAALRVREHLGALGCLAVAVDDFDSMARIQQLDSEALFQCVKSDLIRREFRINSISAWGLALRLQRSRMVTGLFDPMEIARPMGQQADYDTDHDIGAMELFKDPLSFHPDPSEVTMWVIRSATAFMEHNSKRDPQDQDRSSLSNAQRLAQDMLGGDWLPIAGSVMTEVPEFFRSHFKVCLKEVLAAGEMNLLGRLLRECVDWKAIESDHAFIQEDSTGQKFMQNDHPIKMIMDVFLLDRLEQGSVQAQSSEDESFLLALKVMKEHGALDPFVNNDVIFDHSGRCFPHELVRNDMVKSLGFLLQSGMHFDLKNEQGICLLEFCELTNPDGEALALLRAEAAAKSVDQLLAHQKTFSSRNFC